MTAPIGDGVEIRLGAEGPTLQHRTGSVARDPTESLPRPATTTRWRRTPSATSDPTMTTRSVGGRTLMIRKAYQKVQQQQRRTQRLIVAAIALIAIAAGGYAFYAHRALSKQMRAGAGNLLRR